ncbi:MAG: tetratricopeptide repeat protein [Dysgonamonadaceae bacterium]|jgi:tetratricopeptide (TPR) repeat protein|nr:tetratricopeptide repeat protein [Dysgonamonadaceae bacterium]
MKKYLLAAVLCLSAAVTFAQNKALRDAEFELKSASPNIADARAAVKRALENSETANLAKTWYLAGAVENRQFEIERDKISTQDVTGQKPKEDVMYPALDAVYPYFLKAIELDRLPNEKGKVSPKYIKQIKTILWNNRPYYQNSGLFFYNRKDYKKAYENFRTYGDIAALDIYDEKDRKKWDLIDTVETQNRYNAGLMALQAGLHDETIELFEEIKDSGYNEEEIHINLAMEYQLKHDTVNFERIIAAGYGKFPDSEVLLKNMIQIKLDRKDIDGAILIIEAAIASDPGDAQWYDVLGLVYENMKDSERASEYYRKALELEPDRTEYNLHYGIALHNLGFVARQDANAEKDDSRYRELKGRSDDYFRLCMPYLRKVYEDEPDNKTAIRGLHQVYYSLNMGKELDEIEPAYKRHFGGGEK